MRTHGTPRLVPCEAEHHRRVSSLPHLYSLGGDRSRDAGSTLSGLLTAHRREGGRACRDGATVMIEGCR